MTRKLMCGVDFSPASNQALEVATELAVRLGAEILLVHVMDLASVSESIRIGLVEAAEAELELIGEELRGRGVPEVQVDVTSGPVWNQLIDRARQDPDIEHVILGAHGERGVRRMFMGSVAEHVVRHAPCSVTIVRQRTA